MAFPPPTLAAQAQKTTIFKTWKYMGNDSVETIEIGPKEVLRKIVGKGIPGGGVETKAEVVEVIPKATASRGKILTHSEVDAEKGYQIIYWFDLGRDTVKLCIPGRGFCDPQEAKAKGKGRREQARPFRALRWGIQ
ncbi:MAG: hypothetical protein R3257_05595 [bacterium]|nr:hypothetical protein [bacterium]